MTTTMKSFMCNALGLMHEYRCSFSDQLAFVALTQASTGGKLMCRPAGSTAPYSEVEHTMLQVRHVNIVFNRSQNE
jgi:hypothetical protein